MMGTQLLVKESALNGRGARRGLASGRGFGCHFLTGAVAFMLGGRHLFGNCTKYGLVKLGLWGRLFVLDRRSLADSRLKCSATGPVDAGSRVGNRDCNNM
jgi:hypothetical protein